MFMAQLASFDYGVYASRWMPPWSGSYVPPLYNPDYDPGLDDVPLLGHDPPADLPTL